MASRDLVLDNNFYIIKRLSFLVLREQKTFIFNYISCNLSDDSSYRLDVDGSENVFLSDLVFI